MIAISVSTNYDDLLNIILPQNYKFFDKWYIVTNKNDVKTIDVINHHNFPNVETIYYNFHSNKKIFNKGGAIRYCQELISSTNYEGNILLLDSDIYLPDNFMDIVKNIEIKPYVLYGTNDRNDYYSYDHFKNNIIDSIYPYAKSFQGYFQLYRHNKSIIYDHSMNCSECDLYFHRFFHQKILIPTLTVSHLGKSGIHWNGRLNKNDFIPYNTNI
jgi:hypothetical protein